ncbi:MAG: hypothetical protein JNG88_05455 [Phycisphaerales bacterium]|nr:hypothetical protein [Phycisphaerales bacterium]
MNCYHLWCDLNRSVSDIAFVDAVHAYLGYLREGGKIAGYRITRRKFGFSPPELGDFHITIETHDLAQLDEAFKLVATRDDEVERLHAKVFSAVCNLRTALYRDFPDAERQTPPRPALHS